MLFRKKGKLRKQFDHQLLWQLEQAKSEWMRQKNLLQISFDYNEDLLSQTKICEAKYFYLLREAKKRNLRMER
ncbi:YaaL family protein [Aeribacillus pallidus]|jgi:hypothetical protein|uniref:YaaL family protein n=1 Tax=Aeribacillus pallidus TaxID=33936 RepID=UPI001D3285D4|nr:YaaL family protein [Bacillus sp. (in: firmicutes)]